MEQTPLRQMLTQANLCNSGLETIITVSYRSVLMATHKCSSRTEAHCNSHEWRARVLLKVLLSLYAFAAKRLVTAVPQLPLQQTWITELLNRISWYHHPLLLAMFRWNASWVTSQFFRSPAHVLCIPTKAEIKLWTPEMWWKGNYIHIQIHTYKHALHCIPT